MAIVAVAAIAAFTTSGTGVIAASVIGVAGAGLSAYIGSTFMRAQSDASAQLREYFLQPVEFSRMLSAERLVNSIDVPADKSQAVQEIIKAMMPHQKDAGS
jgi:hypothetical protein